MIKLRNVTKIYEHRELPALKDVSLDVQDGEYISIMGQSGSGKSTLLNIIGTMDYLTSGEYYYNDIAVHEMKGDKLHEFRRKHVGFVFQNYALMKSYTVFENVELPLLAGRYSGRERKKLVNEMLEFTGIRDLADKKVTRISGGEQQRCAIARALIKNPKLLLCDEPTGALDSKTSKDILILLEKINQQYGTTMLIVTHNNAIRNMVHKAIIIKDGQISEEYENETRVPAKSLEDL